MNDLAIRTDAGEGIGAGHLIRCLSLSQEALEQNVKVTFYLKSGLPLFKDLINDSRLEVQDIESEEEFIRKIEKNSPDWVVLDGYGFTVEMENKLTKLTQVLTLDDYSHRDRYEATALLNQNISAKSSWYTDKGLKEKNLLLGTDYVLLRNQFLKYESSDIDINEQKTKLLITLGAGNQQEVFSVVLESVASISNKFELIHVLTRKPGDSHYPSNMIFHHRVENMADLMADVDVAISGGGTTIWELLFMGIPPAVLILDENQQEIVNTAEDYGLVFSLGWYSQINQDEIIKKISDFVDDISRLSKIRDLGQQFIDGNGRTRVLNHLRDVDTTE